MSIRKVLRVHIAARKKYEDDPGWNPKKDGNKRGVSPAEARARIRRNLHNMRRYNEGANKGYPVFGPGIRTYPGKPSKNPYGRPGPERKLY